MTAALAPPNEIGPTTTSSRQRIGRSTPSAGSRRRSPPLLTDLLLSLLFFALMIDSGGELGLRTVGLALLVPLSATRLRELRLFPREILIWAIGCVLLSPSLFSSLFKSIPIAPIIVWTFPILVFPLLLAATRANRLTVNHFINGGLLFAVVILILFYGRLNQIDQITAVHDFMSERSAGFFNEKKVFFEDATPVVYFQGTLALVMCAVLAIGQGRYVTYIVVCIALLVAPSRFGVVLSLFFGAAMLGIKFYRRSGFWIMLGFVVVGVTIGLTSAPESFVEIFSSEGEGSQVRLLHVASVLDLFDQKPFLLLLGDGPGTSFFSRGFNALTDNIEISQLEVLRKFGLPFALGITGLLGAVCFRLLHQRCRSMALALIAHYVVAFSNPVLFALPAVFLFAISLAALPPHRFRTCPKSSPSL